MGKAAEAEVAAAAVTSAGTHLGGPTAAAANGSIPAPRPLLLGVRAPPPARAPPKRSRLARWASPATCLPVLSSCPSCPLPADVMEEDAGGEEGDAAKEPARGSPGKKGKKRKHL